MDASIFNPRIFSLYLGGLGLAGTILLVIAAAFVFWHYRDSRFQSFNWRLRNWRLKQLCAVASLFFLAMAASYWVIQEPWGWLYLIMGFKTGTWWVRRAIARGL